LDDCRQWCDRQVSQHVRSCEVARRAARIIGIGELGASAFTASVADFTQFKAGRQFGAWRDIVPRQNSSGGKPSLRRITKRGDICLRTLLKQGAKSAVMSVDKRDDPTNRQLKQLIDRVGWQKACVAMADKNARNLWAVMTSEQGFDAQHVSAKPLVKQKPSPERSTRHPSINPSNPLN
jgi:transposase